MSAASISVLKLRNFPHADLSKADAKDPRDISFAFSSLEDRGIKSATLPARFADIKKQLVKDPEKLKASWLRLKTKLAEEIEKISRAGPTIIPSIEYSELEKLPAEKKEEILKRGCTVVRNVIPRDEARAYKFELEDYIKANPDTVGFPSHAKVMYELYWSKPQIKARTHPRLMNTLDFMNKLWHADEDTEICLDENISYADKLRIRDPGDSLFSLGPHSDGGSIERWEDEYYSKCYQPIWEGRWEDYDAYDATYRVDAKGSLYKSQSNCTMFRSFQGWISLSDINPGEGTILLAPLVKEVTAYFLLKPFFDEKDNVALDSPNFPGTVPGNSQEYSPASHPELELDKLMTHAPPVHPGDMVFWHCDLIHAVDPECGGETDSSVMYIPSTPLCKINTNYAFLQRESFLQKLVAPDFPGFPTTVGESQHLGCAEPMDVKNSGGKKGLQAFGLERLDIKQEYSVGAKESIRKYNELMFGNE